MADKEHKLYLVPFANGEDDSKIFIAYGEDKDYMPVFKITYGDDDDAETIWSFGGENDDTPVFRVRRTDYHTRTHSMRFPSCLKFMPYAVGGEMIAVSRKFIEDNFGEAVRYNQVPKAWLGPELSDDRKRNE